MTAQNTDYLNQKVRRVTIRKISSINGRQEIEIIKSVNYPSEDVFQNMLAVKQAVQEKSKHLTQSKPNFLNFHSLIEKYTKYLDQREHDIQCQKNDLLLLADNLKQIGLNIKEYEVELQVSIDNITKYSNTEFLPTLRQFTKDSKELEYAINDIKHNLHEFYSSQAAQKTEVTRLQKITQQAFIDFQDLDNRFNKKITEFENKFSSYTKKLKEFDEEILIAKKAAEEAAAKKKAAEEAAAKKKAAEEAAAKKKAAEKAAAKKKAAEEALFISNHQSLRYTYFIEYYPKRFAVTGEKVENRRKVWNFKEGKNTHHISNMITDRFRWNSLDDIKEWYFCIIPASNPERTRLRFQSFCTLISNQTGINNGYDMITSSGNRPRTHIQGNNNVNLLDTLSFRNIQGKKIILFDDVITRGQSFTIVTNKLTQLGALKVYGMFLAKTTHL